MKKLSWNPQRRGNIYCSPACGGRCTWKGYLQAKKSARELATSLGPGWRSTVWENLGWHYAASSPCGRIKVHKGCLLYLAFLGEPDSSGDRWAEDGKTAKEAVRNVIAAAKSELRKLGTYIENLPIIQERKRG